MMSLQSDHNYNGKFLKQWSCIILTCPSGRWAKALHRELETLKKKGFIHPAVPILTVEDPSKDMGSGSATFNALLVAADFLSAQKEYGVISTDILKTAHVLVLHHGRKYLYEGCGKGSLLLPGKFSTPWTNLQHLLWNLRMLTATSPPGVWVCSTDLLHWGTADLSSHLENTYHTWENACKLYCIAEDPAEAVNHGAVFQDEKGLVKDIVYCGDEEAIKPAIDEKTGKVPVVAGIVFLPAAVTDSLLSLYDADPLDGCHYLGYDSGTQPLQISLFFDILLAMATGVTETNFVQGQCGKTYRTRRQYHQEQSDLQTKARTLIWLQLSHFNLRPVMLENYRQIYWADQNQPPLCHLQNMLSLAPTFGSLQHCHLPTKENLGEKTMVINSFLSVASWQDKPLEDNVVISCCDISVKSFTLGQNSLLYGLRIVFPKGQGEVAIPPNTFMRRFNLSGFNYRTRCTIIMGIQDEPLMPESEAGSTFCGRPWKEFYEKSGIEPSLLWPNDKKPAGSMPNSLYTARLFPQEDQEYLQVLLWLAQPEPKLELLQKWTKSRRYSLLQLMSQQDVISQFGWMHSLFSRVTLKNLPQTLNQKRSLLPTLRAACAEGWNFRLFRHLDRKLSSAKQPQKQCQLLAYIAELLSLMAGHEGGVRSGPGKNQDWSSALRLFEAQKVKEGLLQLKKIRKGWLSQPDRIMRAARHYEEALLILIRQTVLDRKHLPPQQQQRKYSSVEEAKTKGTEPAEAKTKETEPAEAKPKETEPAEAITEETTAPSKSEEAAEPEAKPENAPSKTEAVKPKTMPIGKMVKALCPGRIDLYGGWTDTPPICYEKGGSVLNLAITVDGQKPIGAEGSLIEEPVIKVTLGKGEDALNLCFSTLQQLQDYNCPTAPGALVKAVLVFSRYVDLGKKAPPLEKQLEGGRGLSLHAWSNLPQGSGLGTSSVLGAALLAVVWTLAGTTFQRTHLIHGVLYVEQLLTTGGGWQDQAGGVMGGAVLATSPAALPVRVTPQPVELQPEVPDLLARHLVLVYTGQVRLAKNILTNVIREWYLQDIAESGVSRTDLFQPCPQEAVEALKTGNLAELGHYLARYRDTKAKLTRGYQPAHLDALMKILEPFAHAQLFPGAGGGGFLAVLLNDPESLPALRSAVEAHDKSLTVHSIEVDAKGLELYVDDNPLDF